jgi:hypothetical protein
MGQQINRLLDYLSENLAHRKGLLPLIGIALVVLNFIVQFIPGLEWLASTNLLLHLGILIAILGFMVAWAL